MLQLAQEPRGEWGPEKIKADRFVSPPRRFSGPRARKIKADQFVSPPRRFSGRTAPRGTGDLPVIFFPQHEPVKVDQTLFFHRESTGDFQKMGPMILPVIPGDLR